MSNLISYCFRSVPCNYLLHWTPTPQFGASCGGIASLNVWVYITVRSPVDSKASCGFGTSRLAIPQLLEQSLVRRWYLRFFWKILWTLPTTMRSRQWWNGYKRKNNTWLGRADEDTEQVLTIRKHWHYLWHIYGYQSVMHDNAPMVESLKKWVHFQWETVRNGSTNPIVYCRVWKHKSKGLSNDELGLSRSKVGYWYHAIGKKSMNITWW